MYNDFVWNVTKTFLNFKKAYFPNLLVTTLYHQIFVVQVRYMNFWLQLGFFKPVKMAGSDFT